MVENPETSDADEPPSTADTVAITGNEKEDNAHTITDNEEQEVKESNDEDADKKSEEDEEASNSDPDESEEPIRSSVSIRDFAYSADDPKHYGMYEEEELGEGETDDEEPIYDGEGSGEEAVFTLKPDTSHGAITVNVNYDSKKEEQEDLEVQAVTLYPFKAESSNELELTTDQVIVIKYEYGDGWLVAYDPETNKTGLVPSSYVRVLGKDAPFAGDVLDEGETSTATRYLPEMLQDESSSSDKEASGRLTRKLKDLEIGN